MNMTEICIRNLMKKLISEIIVSEGLYIAVLKRALTIKGKKEEENRKGII